MSDDPSLSLPRTPPRAAAGHVPGEAGIWVFVLGDMTVFGLLFATFTFYRAADVDLFLHSQATLNQNLGALNTLVLLTSSWFVALGVGAVRSRNTRTAPLLFSAGFLCGLVFAIVKFFEYSEKFRAGLYLTTNDFYSFYYVLTGLHFLHVVIGMVLLSIMTLRARAPEPADSKFVFVECGATYWHMVDLLWVVLFPLLYLMK